MTPPRIQKHLPESTKYLPEPKNTFQNPKTRPRIQKHVPESKNTSQNPKTPPRIQKHLPECKNTPQNPKTRPRIQKHVPESKNTFHLDSGKCFWILGHVLDSGKCFVLTSHRRYGQNYFPPLNGDKALWPLQACTLLKECAPTHRLNKIPAMSWLIMQLE